MRCLPLCRCYFRCRTICKLQNRERERSESGAPVLLLSDYNFVYFLLFYVYYEVAECPVESVEVLKERSLRCVRYYCHSGARDKSSVVFAGFLAYLVVLSY